VHFRGSFFLEKVSTLDLVAILGGVELLHELVVLLGDIRLGQMEDGFRKASILCETSNFASNPLHAFFALQHCHVDVLYSLNHVAKSSGYSAPATGYEQPQTGYEEPQTGYGAPQTGYDSPQTGYGATGIGSGYGGGDPAPQSGGFDLTQLLIPILIIAGLALLFPSVTTVAVNRKKREVAEGGESHKHNVHTIKK
jgi:hypothetical protein